MENLSEKYKQRYFQKHNIMSLDEYLKKASKDSKYYLSPAERLLKAIGKPEIVETQKDPKLGRIFGNRIIKKYPAFTGFYGMEEAIESIVSFLTHAAQGLEENKQIMYFLGPVGGGKSSLAEKLKELMEQEPFYALAVKTSGDKDGLVISPIYENPLGLFTKEDARDLSIPAQYFCNIPSPWALKRLDEFDGDVFKFSVVELYPSKLRQVAISKTEPGDENTQDKTALVGKLDIRKLEYFAQDDPDAYLFNGGLCLGNRGIFEFVEMFKAPLKVLNPLLTATQEHNYTGTEALNPIPYEGIIIAHSNESEWQAFSQNKTNEAFLDRVCIIRVPYCLRWEETKKIYEKFISDSNMADKPIAPKTLDILAKFSVLTAIDVPDNSTIYLKMRAYNGDNLKAEDSSAKSLYDYKQNASNQEGFFGLSTRNAYKIIAKVYNFDIEEVAANPVHMLYLLEKYLDEAHITSEKKTMWTAYIKEYLYTDYYKYIQKDLNECYVESYNEYAQHLFDRYIYYADHWLQDNDFRDPETGQLINTTALNDELESIEKPAGISNAKDFRNEIVNFALRYKANNGGTSPKWNSYEKLKKVIEANVNQALDGVKPVLSHNVHANSDDAQKHEKFITRMMSKGYTARQVRFLQDWAQRFSKSK